MMNIQNIPISALEPNPFQYRTHFPKEEMAELARSIADMGILQPLIVRPVDGKKSRGITHQIVAGERRWRAAKIAHLKTVPVVVKRLTDLEALPIALIENTQRENPTDWDTALGIKNMMDISAQSGAPMTVKDVAKTIQMSLSYVNKCLSLFDLRPELQRVAQKHDGVKSSLFEIQKVDSKVLEEELIEAVEAGTGYLTIKSRVDEYLRDEAWKSESRTPARDSRPKPQKVGLKASDINAGAIQAVKELEWKVDNVEHWLNDATPACKVKLIPQLKAIAERILKL